MVKSILTLYLARDIEKSGELSGSLLILKTNNAIKTIVLSKYFWAVKY